ncbi:MAG: class I SAM-dependent methyltransferase [Promethearchaeota archaeon]
MGKPCVGFESLEAKRIVERLNIISGGKVLDVGTEKGEFINTLIQTLKTYDSFIAIDISNKYFKDAKKRFKKQSVPIDFMEMNAEALDFKDDSFDTVCISYTIHHLKNVDKVLNEMKRVLKPNGHFMIQEMVCDGEQTEAQKTDIIVHHWGAKIDTFQGIPHKETLLKQNLHNLVVNLGLKEVEAFDSPHPLACLFCDERFECDERTHIDSTIKEIEENLNHVKDHPEFEIFKKESETLKKRVEDVGTSPASQMFFIGRK